MKPLIFACQSWTDIQILFCTFLRNVPNMYTYTHTYIRYSQQIQFSDKASYSQIAFPAYDVYCTMYLFIPTKLSPSKNNPKSGFAACFLSPSGTKKGQNCEHTLREHLPNSVCFLIVQIQTHRADKNKQKTPSIQVKLFIRPN